MSENSSSIAEIIANGRWRRAVFTSFTLSLTYFECYVLPRLRAQGCSAIDLYVDALGYRDSLVEQRSRHAGRDYVVHPVHVRSGIFHPKLIYLWPEDGDGDVLMVGSGNLTYAGHGGNLEVFELLRPALHAKAFAQAAVFFGELAKLRTNRIDIGDAGGPLEGLQRRTQALAEKYPNAQDVQFVHCLGEPASHQLIRELAGQEFDEFLVMSPYHHPEAIPVKQLVEATRPRTLLVAVDAKANSSPFPFERASNWECSIRAVAARQVKSRFPHAKWYEWRAAGRATIFTGSFNATAESLTSCSNIECGVLRRDVSPSTEWFEVEPMPFEKQLFPRVGGIGELPVTASLSLGTLSGRIVGYVASAPREWTFSLQSGELAPTASQPVCVNEDGEFKVRLVKQIDTDRESGLQIRMDAGSHAARGWVSLPHILNIGAQRRALLSSLADVGQGSESAAGFAGLLTILMDEIRIFTAENPSNIGQWAGSKHHKNASERGAADAPEPTALPREVITDGPHPAVGGTRERLLTALASGQSGWSVWGQLAHVLLGPSASQVEYGPETSTSPSATRRTVRPPAHPIVHPEHEDDADPEKVEAAQQILLAAIGNFESLIGDCREELQRRIERARAAGEEPEQILLNLAHLERTWLHVMLRAHAGPLNDIPGAVRHVGEWLHRSVDTAFSGAAQAQMLFEYAGCAAVLALQNADKPSALMESLANFSAPTKASRSAQYLEAAFSGAPDIELTLDLATDWLNSQVGHALVGEAVAKAITALSVALSQPTPRALVARYLKERPVHSDPTIWRPLNESMLRLLHAAVRPGRPGQHFGRVDVRAVTSCTVCNRDLRITAPGRDDRRPDPTMLAQLKLFCVAECPKCRAPLINEIALPK
ncbi:hypothetical protein [Massilia sp. TS11]|uniref:hypothetical protein n=1 Tax=Massilia sp. TS11 TaxID=2908003 RepID=UPI001EDC850C|nr:hypothetical protein [Massilia sp. TS11]MCG2583841.1 hypothetical protein [Massilia sp. TS11]